MLQPHVYIVTINFNGTDDTIALLEAIENNDYKNYSVIIVDNSSNPDQYNALVRYLEAKQASTFLNTTEESLSAEEIERTSYTIIRCKNRGFAAANNIVLRQLIQHKAFAGSSYVLMINNDTTPAKDCIEKLVDRYEKEKGDVAIVAPLIRYFNNNLIWSAGGYFKKNLGMLKAYDKETNNYTGPHKINFLTGCAWLIRIEKLRITTGLLDENYFMYAEDLDYCLSVTEKKYRLILEPSAELRHKVGASSNGEKTAFSAYHMMFGRVMTMRKHNKTVGFMFAMFMLLATRFCFVFPKAILQKQTFIITNQWKAMMDALSAKITNGKS